MNMILFCTADVEDATHVWVSTEILKRTSLFHWITLDDWRLADDLRGLLESVVGVVTAAGCWLVTAKSLV